MAHRRLIITLAAVTALIVVACAQSTTPKYPTVFGFIGPGATISLKYASGKAVKTLKPAKYAFKITDRSKTDNFHLIGSNVNLKTPVKSTTVSRWVLTMKRGKYRFSSDKHPKTLKGSFTVI